MKSNSVPPGQMEIRTARCVIRDFALEDIDSFVAYRNNLDWMRYQSYKGLPKEAYEKDLLQNAPLEKGKQLAIVDLAAGVLVGDIYLKQENDSYWIGYTVHPSFARKGYAKEAVCAVMSWAAGQGGRIVRAGVLPENTPSIRLLEQLGFTCTAQEDGELVYTFYL